MRWAIKSGRTLQGSVHAKQRGENAYRRPGHTVAYIGAEFWDSVKRTPSSSRCGWSPKAPCRSCTPAIRHGIFRRTAARWNSCPSSTPRPVHPAQRRTSSPQRAVSPTPAAPAKRGTASAVRWASGAPPAPWAKSSTRCSRWAPAWTRSPTSGSFVPVHPAPAGAGSGRFAG